MIRVLIKTDDDWRKDPKSIVSMIMLTVVMVSQIVLSFFLYNPEGIQTLRLVGWVVLFVSAIFGWLPIFTFRKKGKVPKGKSFVHTTVLVDSGIYAVVRHPQFLAGILLSLSLTLIVQHWIITVLGIVGMIILYHDIREGDKSGVEKFGDDYKNYMQKVPRMNFLAGILRLLRHRNPGVGESDSTKGQSGAGGG